MTWQRTYKGRFRKLLLPSKQFQMSYENALEKLDLKYSLSETASRQILTDLEQAYVDIWKCRQVF